MNRTISEPLPAALERGRLIPRIISGQWRGHPLHTPDGPVTRPTSDRIKEAVFSSIHDGLPDAYFLDCCAGSGSMGLEALSRGAARSDLVEPERRAIEVIRRNIQMLGAQQAFLHRRPLKQALAELEALIGTKALPEGYDFIFLDPPYKQGPAFGRMVAEAIGNSRLLNPAGLFIHETDAGDPPLDYTEFGLILDRMKRYGNTVVTYYKKLNERNNLLPDVSG